VSGAKTGRVGFPIGIKRGTQEEFLRSYEGIRHLVAEGVDGHMADRVCQDPNDPDSWLITSEGESLEHVLARERTPEHRDLVKSMRDCFAEAKVEVVKETGH